MRTHVQARLIIVPQRQHGRIITQAYLALRTTQIEIARDAAGVAIPLTTITNRLLQIGGAA